MTPTDDRAPEGGLGNAQIKNLQTGVEGPQGGEGGDSEPVRRAFGARRSSIERAATARDLGLHLDHAGLDLTYPMAHEPDEPVVGTLIPDLRLPRGARLSLRGCACFSRNKTTVVRICHEPTGSIGTWVQTIGFSPPYQTLIGR